jgi:hypothetical protein
MDQKVDYECVTNGDIMAALAKGPGHLSQVLHDYCDDVATLAMSMKNLMSQNKDTTILLALSHITVSVVVHSGKMNKDILNIKFGATDESGSEKRLS